MVILIFFKSLLLTATCVLSIQATNFDPTVTFVILASNKAHTLPYYLAMLDKLDYPKNRISIYVRSDNCYDETPNLLRNWISKVNKLYHRIDANIEDKRMFRDADSEKFFNWTPERFKHIMKLRQDAFKFARSVWSDYVWFLDCDAFITDSSTLRNLINHSGNWWDVAVAPLLTSLGLYANFWAGMDDKYYYLRTPQYTEILKRENSNSKCHSVKMIHSATLVNLRRVESQWLTFVPNEIAGYDGPEDDIIAFAISAQMRNISLFICNDKVYGYIMQPLDDTQSFHEDEVYLNKLIQHMKVESPFLPFLSEIALRPYSSLKPFDHVYVINLERRPDRLRHMNESLHIFEIEFELVKAVDGRLIDAEYIQKNGIQMMPLFEEPYHKRRYLKPGEIGCFLSHYNIWLDIVANKKYDIVIVFEDDVRFENFFRQKLMSLGNELIQAQNAGWDFVYLGRKILSYEKEEKWTSSAELLRHVDYTYWTLGYIITRQGAQKLLDGEPLNKMIPVDEYIPIMYDRHPNISWKMQYNGRNLVALTAHPLLIHPTHYVGESGYISDTEDEYQKEANSAKDEL